MIYSPQLRYCYIHIPKCGGNTIKVGLRWKTKSYQHLKDRKPPHGWGKKWKYGTVSCGHRTALEAAEIIPGFDRYWKFTTVRNPWARIVSAWAHSMRKDSITDKCYGILKLPKDERPARRAKFRAMTFDYWLEYVQAENWNHYGDGNILTALQSDWVDDDFDVFKLENLSPLEAALLERYGREVRFGRENITPHEDYRSYYTSATWDLVARKQGHDIEKYAYDMVYQ